MPHRLDAQSADFEAAFTAFLTAKRDAEEDVAQVVSAVVADVRARGDAALLDYTRRFDRVTLTASELRVSDAVLDDAADACPPETRDALAFAARRIEAHHERLRPTDLDHRDPAGLRVGHRWTPVASAGLYVPGGTAAYPSSVLMNALPAKVAGVEELIMVVPTPGGELNELVLAAAHICGVDKV